MFRTNTLKQRHHSNILPKISFRIFTVIVLALVMGCGEKDPELSYPLETARLISHATSGIISADGDIQVKFVSPVIKDNLSGEQIKSEVFSFSPAIDGVTSWKDTRTLVFKPVNKLPLRQSYEATLDLPKLLPLHKDALESFQFRFETAGREITRVDTDFQLETDGDPKSMQVIGTVEFTENVSLDNIRHATSLQRDSRALTLNWQGEDPGKRFTFTSAAFQRGDKTQNFNIAIDKDVLEISEDYQSKFSLSPISDLAVQSISQREESAGKSTIVVDFSDELDTRQDITGLISVSPAVDFKMKTVGKKVYLTGDFKNGTSYDVNVSQGLKSRWSTETSENYSKAVQFAELKPQLKFASDGFILPSVNDRRIRFHTVNLSRVRIEVKKVFENNLGQFIQTERLSSNETRNEAFDYSYTHRVGVVVHTDTLVIGAPQNEWVQNELDLSQVITRGDNSLYLVHINFRHEDMMYGDPAEFEERRSRYYYGEDYYSNPYSHGYLYAHGNIYKPLTVSDIGLTYKRAHKEHIIYTTDIETARPLSGVNITLKTYQNQEIDSKRTDGDGYVSFTVDGDEDVFYVEASKDGQRSVVKPGEMAWNLSTFDTEGVSDVPGGTRAFIYSERGVYRPGDAVNLSVIARNDENSFPDAHPVTMKIYNPRNRKAFEQTTTDGKNGFYNFNFTSGIDDPTGNWRVEVLVGSSTFYHNLKIETVVPFRLKVNVTPEKTPLSAADRQLNATLQSNYLFGNPAANLDADVRLTLQKRPKSFPAYRNFVFDNQTMDFREIEKTIYDGKLDLNGNANISWQLPSLRNVPSSLSARLEARVYEKGGRPNTGRAQIAIEPFENYVGLQKPDFAYGYAKVGAEASIPAILVDQEGRPVPGKSLNYRIYRGTYYWWWEYDNSRDYYLRFKSDASTELVSEGTVVSTATPQQIAFIPENRGTYFIEVQDGSSGHTAGIFMRAYPWGEGGGSKDAGVMALRSDKDSYLIGETVQVSFPAPQEGAILLSVEKGQKVLSSRWYSYSPGDEELTIPIPTTAEMAPTAYVSVSIIQPHAQTLNDRPIRMYGVVPINVENPATHQQMQITMPEQLRSGENFRIDLATTDRKPTQFTVAVVDEGLLDLTGFKTPDPWSHYFRKLRLGVQTFDLFADIIGANKGDVLNVFSIGGGIAEEYRQSQLDNDKKKRFKPVALFQGPTMTDDDGKASIEFTMPNYVGAVRVMVVNAQNSRYGKAEKTVPVKTELMVVPSLPRVIGPADQFTVPVTVFAMEEEIGDVDVSLALEGPLQTTTTQQTLNFEKVGEQDVLFQINANAAVGQAKITIRAESDAFSSFSETDISVRPSSPRIYDDEEKVVEPGKTITFKIPDRGIPGSNFAELSLRRRPSMNFGNRLMSLVRYPYGCIEQTTSSVFPQLYLTDMMRDDRFSNPREIQREVDRNINRAIKRLRRFQLPSGAFAYWPGNNDPSEWGTLYAGHFLIEAKKLGYSVPDDLYNSWMRYMQSKAMDTRPGLKSRAYGAYLLALAGDPAIGTMNLLRENSMSDMDNAEKWMLAGAYQLAGVNRTATQITRNLGMDVREYSEFSGTYGSTLRDKAIILEQLVVFENWGAADQLANELTTALSSRFWYSTQTSAFMMLSLGKYLKALEGNSETPPSMKGTITLPNGEKVPFDTEGRSFTLSINEGFGENLTLDLASSSNLARAFATLAWDGVPLRSDVQDEAKNLSLNVSWLNDDGQPISPADIQQGTTFWGHFSVKNPANIRIDEIALVQVLPSGWEIVNTRLSGEDRPGWMRNWRLNREEYVDIRDDRIMWFFDLRNWQRSYDFVVKLSAVTVGEFHLPPTVVEAMYNDDYKATKAGMDVKVSEK